MASLIWGNTDESSTWISKSPDKVDEMERLFKKGLEIRHTMVIEYLVGILLASVDPTPVSPVQCNSGRLYL